MAKQISAPYIECSAQQSENSVRDIFHIATLACISKSNKNVKHMKSSRATKRSSHVSRPELGSVSCLHKTKTKTCTVMWFQKPFHLHAFILLSGFLLEVHWGINWREIFCTPLVFTICTGELSERHVLMMMHSILPYLKAPQNILAIIINQKQGKHLFLYCQMSTYDLVEAVQRRISSGFCCVIFQCNDPQFMHVTNLLD